MSENEMWLWAGVLMSWVAMFLQGLSKRTGDRLIEVQRQRIEQLERHLGL